MYNKYTIDGIISFGGSLELSTIKAILSTRNSIDLLFPDRMFYLIHHKGDIFYSKLEVVEGKLKTMDGNLLNLSDVNIVYLTIEGDDDFIEVINKEQCNFDDLSELYFGAKVTMYYRDDELFEVTLKKNQNKE